MFSRIGLFCISVLLSGAVLAQSQTPDAARNYFEHGTKHYKQGDFDRAIEDFSKAIEISSYLTVSNRGSKRRPSLVAAWPFFKNGILTTRSLTWIARSQLIQALPRPTSIAAEHVMCREIHKARSPI